MKAKGKTYLLVLIGICLIGCSNEQDKSSSEDSKIAADTSLSAMTKQQMIEEAIIGSEFSRSQSSAAIDYRKAVQNSLERETPILALDDLTDELAKTAQDIFLEKENLERFLFHPESKLPLRNEVMSVLPLLAGDLNAQAQHCKAKQCYRIDVYNFYYNLTFSAVVDLTAEKVIKISEQRETQPDLSVRLEELAKAIASNEPLVQLEIARYQKASGTAAENMSPLMASTKSSLNNSLCERSQHLCVAPTYVLGEQALWVIVDLTDFKVAGIRWTNLGRGQPQIPITERKIENEFVFETYCEKTTKVARNGWSFEYNLTASDGIRLANISHQNTPVLNSAKVVDWHVSYSKFDGFGYSDATGCPMFSSAVVVAHAGPSIEPLMEDNIEVGFALTQDFRQLPWPAPCNYRYQERYEFYNDGRYRIALSNLGRGCGDNGTYRPVLRLEIADPPTGAPRRIEQYVSDKWKSIDAEQWSLADDSTRLFENTFSHRIVDERGSGWLLEPAQGQFDDGGRGDKAYIYTTVNHADIEEGASDLVTLGSCCNKDHQQGPELFMDPPESLENQSLVLWYVPQLKNDGQAGQEYCWAETSVLEGVPTTKTWPCTAGPMFTPFSLIPAATAAASAETSK